MQVIDGLWVFYNNLFFLFFYFRAQGACISHVLPEFLLEPEDYKKWIEITVREFNFWEIIEFTIIEFTGFWLRILDFFIYGIYEISQGLRLSRQYVCVCV